MHPQSPLAETLIEIVGHARFNNYLYVSVQLVRNLKVIDMSH